MISAASGGLPSSSLTLLDTRATVQVDSDEAAAGVRRALAPFLDDAPPDPESDCFSLVDGDNTGIESRQGMLLAYHNGRIVGGGDCWGDVFGFLMASLNRKVIEEYRGFALHAGVVAAGGRAIGFPADSGGGKSTLTAACLRAGFDYVSDEALCIDVDSGAVVVYPKPLGLSEWSRNQVGVDPESVPLPVESGEAMVTPADLGAQIATGPLELAAVVVPSYEGGDPPSLVAAEGYVAMSTLLEFSFNHFKHGARAFTLAADLANRVDVWQLDYRDPNEAARLLRERLT